jgi:hypothetical protein
LAWHSRPPCWAGSNGGCGSRLPRHQLSETGGSVRKKVAR